MIQCRKPLIASVLQTIDTVFDMEELHNGFRNEKPFLFALVVPPLSAHPFLFVNCLGFSALKCGFRDQLTQTVQQHNQECLELRLQPTLLIDLAWMGCLHKA